ncbi:MAG: hypothetical protein IPL98_04735 [Saprospiraceae bacterium]|nr:hypothetical protein [Saprospiraceae bacterium]
MFYDKSQIILLDKSFQLLYSSAFAQNSLVGDGFGGRLWYVPSNYCVVGSYSAYSVCYTDTCGNSLSNQLYAWGSNSTLQLGIDSTGNLLGSNMPTKVIGINNVKFYTCGYYMAAIKQDNSGWMWGTSGFDTIKIAKPLKVVDDVKHADAGIYGVHLYTIMEKSPVYLQINMESVAMANGIDFLLQ